jgi:hypothetical protein
VCGSKLEHISLEPTLNTPRDGKANLAFGRLKEQFGPGQVNLYRVVIVLPADGDELVSEVVFDKIHKLFINGTEPGLLIDPKSKAYVPGLEVG